MKGNEVISWFVSRFHVDNYHDRNRIMNYDLQERGCCLCDAFCVAKVRRRNWSRRGGQVFRCIRPLPPHLHLLLLTLSSPFPFTMATRQQVNTLPLHLITPPPPSPALSGSNWETPRRELRLIINRRLIYAGRNVCLVGFIRRFKWGEVFFFFRFWFPLLLRSCPELIYLF